MRFTTYKQTTGWANASKFSDADVAEAMAQAAAHFERMTNEAIFNGNPAKVQLIFPKVTPARKATAFQWKLYVERQPLTPFIEVQP